MTVNRALIDPLAIFDESIEDYVQRCISDYRETTPHFAVLHEGKARFLQHHEAYDLVILALDILSEPHSCQAIRQAREDHALISQFEPITDY